MSYNWTKRLTGAWYRCASSSNGMKLAASNSNYLQSYIYTSSDAGLNWTPRATDVGEQYWNDIASSANGNILLSAIWDTVSSTYVSIDSGVTWINKTDVQDNMISQADCSSDGTKMYQCSWTGKLWISSDTGDNWSYKTPSDIGSLYQLFNALCCSSDGTKVFVGLDGDGVCYRSTDSGATWSPINVGASDTEWHDASCSDDGSVILVVQRGGAFISTDSGANWNEIFTGTNCYSCNVDSNGSHMQIGTRTKLYCTTDYGANWIDQGIDVDAEDWVGDIESSSTGNKIIACTGNLYTAAGRKAMDPTTLLVFR